MMTINDKIKLSKNITIVSRAFCVLVSLLLIFNYWQFAKYKPLESKTIEVLVNRLKSEPNNDELKQEIRNFDLLVRKAYFNSRWQVQTGAVLLLLGAVVFAGGLRFYYIHKSKIEEPSMDAENELTSRLLSQRWIIISGAALIVLALAGSFLTSDHLADYSSSAQVAQSPENSPDEQIEVVEVGAPVASDSTIARADSASGGQAIALAETMVQPTTAQASAPTVLNAASIQANSNSFRGPWGNGVSFQKNIPVEWDGASGTNMLWKVVIPKPGYNSPIVWGDKIFLSGADKQVREVYCIDRNTGKILWTKRVENIPGSPATPPKVSEDTGLAASSLTTDGTRVIAIFATGDIVCFDFDGNQIWARNLGLPDNHYGHSSSLITWNGKVFVQYDTNRGGKIMALSITDGTTVWETVRASKISWASPVLVDIGGKKQLVLTADPIVAGYDVETGKELWKVECMMGEVGASVAFGSGLIFAANEYARLVAIDPATSAIKWQNDEYLPEAASLVCADGMVFVATSYGIFACYDALSGEKLWEYDCGTGFYSSPVVADKKVYVLDLRGVMHILALSRAKTVMGTPKLGEDGFATPAFSEGKIFIRGSQNLFCFGK